MRCPFCSYHDSKVNDSRAIDDFKKIRRRRECLGCGKRFTTYEIIEDIAIFVIKKNGDKEIFNHKKLVSGMLKACEKRPVSVETIDNFVSSLEDELSKTEERSIHSKDLGDRCLEKLKTIDKIAYLRYASVSKGFNDIAGFQEELDKLIEKD